MANVFTIMMALRQKCMDEMGVIAGYLGEGSVSIACDTARDDALAECLVGEREEGHFHNHPMMVGGIFSGILVRVKLCGAHVPLAIGRHFRHDGARMEVVRLVFC